MMKAKEARELSKVVAHTRAKEQIRKAASSGETKVSIAISNGLILELSDILELDGFKVDSSGDLFVIRW